MSTKPYVATVDGRWGKCSFFDKDVYIGRSMANYGECFPDESEFLVMLAGKAGKDKLMLDIGANIGVISQALEYSGFTVEAFEPQPEVFELLRENIKGKAHNTALGAKAGELAMPNLDYSQANNFGGISVNTASKSRGAIKVPVATLDSFNYQNVGLIKIDVEGFEEEVLKGAVETIKRCSPIMYIEDDRVEKSASLHKFLAELGYRFEMHSPPLYRAKNFFNKQENIWDRNYVSKNLVCVK